MFFAGKQDIEDSISNDVWISFVEEATESKVILTENEIQELKNAVPDNVEGMREQKFYRTLEKLVKQKLNDLAGEQITGSMLPSKGNDSAQLLLKHIKSIDQVSPEIKSSFDRLVENKPIV
jgi:vacuolar-type H+-ATPase subunit E/Vma4